MLFIGQGKFPKIAFKKGIFSARSSAFPVPVSAENPIYSLFQIVIPGDRK